MPGIGMPNMPGIPMPPLIFAIRSLSSMRLLVSSSTSSATVSGVSTPIQDLSGLDSWLTDVQCHSTDEENALESCAGISTLKRSYSGNDFATETSSKKQRVDDFNEISEASPDTLGLYPPLESSLLDQMSSGFDFNVVPPVTIDYNVLGGDFNVDYSGSQTYGLSLHDALQAFTSSPGI